MARASGTISSATPGLDLITAIETLMAAHSNWQLVDTVVITTTTYKVYKNFGTGVTDNNSFGQDFYIALIYVTATPNSLSFRAFENYDPATDLMIRPVADDQNNATNADASVGTLSGIALNSGFGGQTGGTLLTAPNTNDYFIILNKNGLHVGFRRSDLAGFFSAYAGLFQSMVTIPNEFPLCMGVNNNGFSTWTSVGATWATSRHPGRASQATNVQNCMFTIAGITTTSGDTANVDLFTGKARAAPIALLQFQSGTVGNIPAFGRLRGLLYNCVSLPIAAGVTVNIGDKLLSVDGHEYWNMSYAWVDSEAV